LLFPATSPLAGQAVLTGTIRHDSTGRPLVDAEVVIDGLGRRAVSDQSGRYVELEPLEVRGQPRAPRGIGREAFEERRRMGFGRFIDSTVLRRSEHLKLSDLLRRHTGVLVLATDGHGGGLAVSTRAGYCPSGRPCCYLQIIVDGVVRHRGGPVYLAGTPPNLKEFELHALESVEVYRSAAETPIEFGGASAECGTIVLWTRRGP
jgi:hypothetical protein